MSNTWLDIGKEEEFNSEFSAISVGDEKVIVVQIDGSIHAFSAKCPHKKASLEKAELDGAIVTCPLHAWQFDLNNGGAEINGYESLPKYEVKVENGMVYIK